METILRLFLMSIAIFTFATTSFAQGTPAPKASDSAGQKPETKTEKPKQRVKPSRFDGTVAAFDAEAGKLTVKDKKGIEKSFTVEDKNVKTRLERASVGHAIRVSYVEKDGKLVATSLAGGLGGHEPAK